MFYLSESIIAPDLPVTYNNDMKSICVFCGSGNGNHPVYKETASQMGKFIAEQGLKLVYGGGNVGLMGAVANGCLDAGGKVMGVIPKHLMKLEVGHLEATELHVVDNMHERKQLMYDSSDLFISLPGGFGTLDESFEVLTWIQLGLMMKPLGFLNIHGYFDALITFLNTTCKEGFVSQAHRNMVMCHENPVSLLESLCNFKVEYIPKIQGKNESC
jgi:uncharacterized protein (TIGR00730 family)